MSEEKIQKKKPVRDLFRAVLNKLNLAGLIQLYVDSAIKDDGWFLSYKTKQSVDKNGNPIPWNTYPFLSFIEPRLKSDFEVFEYGSGNSTIWYAKKVSSIIAVEHDKEWYDKIKETMPKNAEIILSSESDSGIYAGEISKRGKRFHIIIVDGIFRNESLSASFDYLRDDGVIVFDDAERDDYIKSFELLKEKGFRRIDFRGMRGITSIANATAIFYRDNNCLNI
ncbi:MAG: class I SAM-dependent methyltransferase [Chlorobi bacterium]|nr:class I SAM-dependent methyltransferase [Chlorobiota bacterium]